MTARPADEPTDPADPRASAPRPRRRSDLVARAGAAMFGLGAVFVLLAWILPFVGGGAHTWIYVIGMTLVPVGFVTSLVTVVVSGRPSARK